MKPEEIEITEEEIKTGEARLKELVLGTINEEKAAEDPAEAAYNVLAKDFLLIKLLADGKEAEAMERMQHLTAGLSLNTIFAKVKEKDGTEQPLTGAVLLDLINKGIEKEEPEAAEKLEYLLEAMLEYAGTLPDIKSNPIAAKTLEALHTLLEYLQQGAEAAGNLDKFLKEQKAFMTIPRPAGLEDFLSISAGKGNKELTIKEYNNSRIAFKGRLTIDEQKINEMLRLAFTSQNPYRASTGLNTLIELPFSETMDILGKPATPDNKKYFSRQLRKETLPNIAHQYIELKDKEGNFIRIEIGGGYFAVNVRKDKIYFKLSDPYSAYLNNGALSQYSSKTLRLGSQKNPLPFYLAVKLQDHYFHDGNRQRKDKQGNPQPTNTIISIKTLLKFCADMIPSYEYVQETDRGHWIRRIKEPLEAALNEIQNKGLFTWQYCKSGLAEATPQEIRTKDFYQWNSLYITFALIPEEPEQAERLEHKQKRLEAAQAKQAVKEAETIIKADKIKKRQDKTSKEQQKG